MSKSEIRRGDRLMPREDVSDLVMEHTAPGNVDGKIIFLPDERTITGNIDFVFLNRGSVHGLDPGIALEVYRPGRRVRDTVRGTRRRVPDDVVAKITVVKASRRSAVAYVAHATTELVLGDRFRSGR